MSFVGDSFEHDVFISYSHGDVDGDGVSLLKQWSAGFAAQLEEELKVQPGLGKDIKVFRDEHHRPDQGLDPQVPLTEQLKQDIKGSAVLALLMSPHYLASTWCRDEREWWFQAQRELGLPAEGRAALARIWDTAEAIWPEGLTDSARHRNVGRNFFDDDQQRPFEWPKPDENSKGEFRKALLGLVGDITKHLTELKDLIEENKRKEAERQRLRAPDGQLIYLHARDDQGQHWEKTGAELEKQGYVLLPDGPDPKPSDRAESRNLSDERVRTLTGCDALLLLSGGDARSLISDLVVVGRQERHEAKDRSGKLLPCAVLEIGQLATPEERVRVTARRLGIDWIDTSRADWPAAIHPWLRGAAA